MENLTNDNFLLYAAKHYISPHYIEQEFFNDIKRIKYVKRLIQKYRSTNELKERLILNHLILLYNVFETSHCTKMLFLKTRDVDHSCLKTFLVYLNFMPEVLENINGKKLYSSNIPIDFTVADALRKL